jgi:hypothetical protein
MSEAQSVGDILNLVRISINHCGGSRAAEQLSVQEYIPRTLERYPKKQNMPFKI